MLPEIIRESINLENPLIIACLVFWNVVEKIADEAPPDLRNYD